MTFRMPDSFYEPPADCCDNDECAGDLCVERAEQARLDDATDRTDALRKGEDR